MDELVLRTLSESDAAFENWWRPGKVTCHVHEDRHLGKRIQVRVMRDHQFVAQFSTTITTVGVVPGKPSSLHFEVAMKRLLDMDIAEIFMSGAARDEFIIILNKRLEEDHVELPCIIEFLER